MPACYRHPGRETSVSCSNCDRPICPDCMTPTPVGMRCPECSNQRTQVRRVNFGGLGASAGSTATFALIALNVAFFVAGLGQGGSVGLSGGGSLIRDFAVFGPAIHDGEIYRIVTGGFLHAGLIHIAFNMYALYFLGRLLEPAVGTPRFAGVYFASLLGGSCGALVLDPAQFTVGASGAVFGLMSATYLIARNRGHSDLAQQIGFFVLINLVFSFSVARISVGGHVGGLIAGALVGMAITVGERRSGGSRALIEWGAIIAVAGLAVAGCLIAAAQ